MSASDLLPSYPKRIWLDRFSARLMQLKSAMSFPTAAKHAVATWPEAADLEPEEAAEIYAIDIPPANKPRR